VGIIVLYLSNTYAHPKLLKKQALLSTKTAEKTGNFSPKKP
jgi:hypothetical protein